MQLAAIPQILTYTGLSQADRDAALDYAKQNRIFAGQAAVALNLQTPQQMDQALLAQSAQKIAAAKQDMAAIETQGAQAVPAWLKPNWGNNGVNPASASPSATDSLSALANVSQNIVLLANQKPAIAPQLKAAVTAAEELSKIVLGSSASPQLADALTKQVEIGLRAAVQATGATPADAQGGLISVDKFIEERFKEVQAGVDLAMARQGNLGSPATPGSPGWSSRVSSPGDKTPGGGRTP